MNALVTGCAGFIGSHLCEKLIQRNDRVIGIDCLTSYYARETKTYNLTHLKNEQNFTFIECDLNQSDLRDHLETVDCVFHTAGQPGVRGSWGDKFQEYTNNNILATQRLLEMIKSIGKPIKVIYSSSSSIYGNVDRLPTSEDSLPRPYSPYGTTKLAAEHLCMLYHANYKIPVVSLRYFTVYGPRQRPDMAFHIFIKALLESKTIKVLGDGKQTRDFTYVSDIVDANIAASEKPIAGEILNLGGGSRTSLNETLKILGEISGTQPILEYNPAIQGDVRDTWADTEKAQLLLEFQPKVTLREGLKNQYEWEKAFY